MQSRTKQTVLQALGELGIRLLLLITCIGVAFAAAMGLERILGLASSRLFNVIVALAAIATYLALRPIAIRFYPRLK